MLLILYNARKCAKYYEILSCKSLLNDVMKWETCDQFGLEWYLLNYANVSKSISYIYAHNTDITSTQVYTDLKTHKYIILVS